MSEAADGERPGRGRRSFEERLLEAALDVVTAHGLGGLTMARLADRLGGSRMTLHRRGVTREDVIGLLAARAAEEYQRAVWPALTSPGTGRERLEHALSAICAVADRYAPLLVGLYADDAGIFHDVEGTQGPASLIATRHTFVDPIARLLRDGAADGTLRATDAESTATVLFNQVGWAFLALRAGQRWPADQATRAVIDLALNGLAAGVQPNSAPGGRPGSRRQPGDAPG